MTTLESERRPPRYREPSGEGPRSYLVTVPVAEGTQRYAFYDRIEIGRDDGVRAEAPGLLLVHDVSVSRSHCIVSRQPVRGWLLRDTSRNGTRLDGRRVVPNLEIPVHAGQVIGVGASAEFLLAVEDAASLPSMDETASTTVWMPTRCLATVLVGDIRDYSVLVRRAPPAVLQQSVGRVFERLGAAVLEQGGTVKEYQGDAVLAYWEGAFGGEQTVAACRAALALDALVLRLAADRETWQVDGLPLQMDWALATGMVLIDSFGGRSPAGLSLIGEPVVLAFRLEKFATPETGRVLACPVTRELARAAFAFRDLGEMTAKGFDRPDHVFALEEPLAGGA